MPARQEVANPPLRCVGPDLNRRTSTGQRPQRCAVGLAWLPTLVVWFLCFRTQWYPRVTKRVVDFLAECAGDSYPESVTAPPSTTATRSRCRPLPVRQAHAG